MTAPLSDPMSIALRNLDEAINPRITRFEAPDNHSLYPLRIILGIYQSHRDFYPKIVRKMPEPTQEEYISNFSFQRMPKGDIILSHASTPIDLDDDNACGQKCLITWIGNGPVFTTVAAFVVDKTSPFEPSKFYCLMDVEWEQTPRGKLYAGAYSYEVLGDSCPIPTHSPYPPHATNSNFSIRILHPLIPQNTFFTNPELQ